MLLVAYRLETRAEVGILLGGGGLEWGPQGRSDRVTRAAAQPTPLLWAADMELQTHANLGTRPGSYASQENRCPSHIILSISSTCNCLWSGPSRSKDESPVFSDTPVLGTLPKPLSSPSHPHSITDYRFPPPAPFVLRSEHLEAKPHSAGTL